MGYKNTLELIAAIHHGLPEKEGLAKLLEDVVSLPHAWGNLYSNNQDCRLADNERVITWVCSACDSEFTVELYRINGTPLNLSQIISPMAQNAIEARFCPVCGAKFHYSNSETL